jgi:hypothetical protein
LDVKYIGTLFVGNEGIELDGDGAEVARRLLDEADYLTGVADVVADPDVELADVDYDGDDTILVVETHNTAKAEAYGFDEMLVDGAEEPVPTPWAEAAERARLAKIEQEKAAIAERLAAAGIEATEWAIATARDLRPDSPEVAQARKALDEATKASAALALKITAVIHPERAVQRAVLPADRETAYRNLVAAKGEAAAKQILMAIETVTKGDVAKQIKLLYDAAGVAA